MDEVIAIRLAGLTSTHRRMLRLAAAGATPADIGLHLDMAPRTVHDELTVLLATLGVHDAHEAAIIWWGSRAGARPDLAIAAQGLVA
jgi:DNA-binding NarL/FixJ family response regulator